MAIRSSPFVLSPKMNTKAVEEKILPPKVVAISKGKSAPKLKEKPERFRKRKVILLH